VTFRLWGEKKQIPVFLAIGAALLLLALPTGSSEAGWLVTWNLKTLLWGLVVTAASWMQGTIFLRLFTDSFDNETSGFWFFLAGGAGFALLSLEAFLLGLAGYFTRSFLTLLVLMVLAACWIVMKMFKVPLFLPIKPPEISTLPALGLAGVALFFNFAFVLVPPVYFDAMSYHLELPSRYLLEHRVFHVTENLYSGYPQLVEILYGVGLALDGVGAAGIISFMGLLLLLGLVWSWCRNRYDDETAAWAVVMIAFTPPVMILAPFFHNDLYMAFFTLAAVFILADKVEGRKLRSGSFVLAGVMAGFAAGTKYTGLGFAIGVPVIVGLTVHLKRAIIAPVKGDVGEQIRGWGVFTGTALLTASPWYLKNLVFTGDPLFPLLSGLRGHVPGLSSLATDAFYKGNSLADIWQWTLVPYQAVFRFWELQLPMSIGLVPLVLLPTLVWLARDRFRTQRVDPLLFFWMIVSLTVWYLTFRAGRFALPMAVMLFVWFAAAFRGTVSESFRAGSALTVIVVFLLMINLASFLGFVTSYADMVTGAFGRITARNYLASTYAPFGALDYLNHLEPDGKVLFLGEMKGFYSNFQREVPTFDVPHRLVELVRKGNGSDRIADTLREKGFSHILFNPQEYARLSVKSPLLRLDKGQQKLMDTFLADSTRAVYSGGGLKVLEIADE